MINYLKQYTSKTREELINTLNWFDLPFRLKAIFAKEEPSSGTELPYKVYTALLTQSGTDAPVATVLENTLGGDVVWSYVNVGEYQATLIGSFIENRVGFTSPLSSINDCLGGMERVDNDNVRLRTVAFNLMTASDEILFRDMVEIRVYN